MLVDITSALPRFFVFLVHLLYFLNVVFVSSCVFVRRSTFFSFAVFKRGPFESSHLFLGKYMQKSFFQLPRCVYIQMASLLSKNHAVASRDLYSPHQ